MEARSSIGTASQARKGALSGNKVITQWEALDFDAGRCPVRGVLDRIGETYGASP
jgi:hypothetical protein